MSGLQVRPISADELTSRPEFAALVQEYEQEAKGAGLPASNIRPESYRSLEAVGALHVFAAFLDGTLIGFISIVASKALHFHRVLPVSESWFVTRSARGTLAGLKLLRAAEEKAEALSDLGLRVSVPAGSGLDRLLVHEGYVVTNIVLHKGARKK